LRGRKRRAAATASIVVLALWGCGSTTGRIWTANPVRAGSAAMDPARIVHPTYETEPGLPEGILDHVWLRQW